MTSELIDPETFFVNEVELLRNKSSSKFVKIKWFKLSSKQVTPAQEYRIAGAMSSTSDYYKYIAMHWGYTVPNDNKPGESFPRSFACIEETNREGEVIVECPECTKIKQLSGEKERFIDLTSANSNGKIDKKKAGETWKTNNPEKYEWLYRHNRDGKYVVRAKNRAGEWGFLKLNGKTQKKVATFLTAPEEQAAGKVNPLHSTGQWFKFQPVDNKGDFMVSLAEGPPDRLTQADLQWLKNSPGFTHKELGIAVLTQEEIKQLVDTHGAAAKSVFNKGRTTTKPAAPEGSDESYAESLGLED